MKNITLHKQLKKFQDKWFYAEKKLIQQRLDFAKMVNKIPQNRNGLVAYLGENGEIEQMMADLQKEVNKMNTQRLHIMSEFPVDRTSQKDIESTVTPEPENKPTQLESLVTTEPETTA